MIEVYFNRPRLPAGGLITRLVSDIASAQERLCIASAWFTDGAIADAFVASRAKRKVVLINAGDAHRGSRRAIQTVERHMADRRGSGDLVFHLGSGDWKEGVMHHKFVLVDQRVVWTGSYNLTIQARTNYENLLRIEDVDVASAFWQEVTYLCETEYLLWMGNSQGAATPDGRFRCNECEGLFRVEELGADWGSSRFCKRCERRSGRPGVPA